MAFDPKAVFSSQAFSLSGGVVIGLGVFWLIKSVIEHLVQPLFNIVFDNNGMVPISRNQGIYIGCGPFIAACFICVICLVLGFVMIRASNK